MNYGHQTIHLHSAISVHRVALHSLTSIPLQLPANQEFLIADWKLDRSGDVEADRNPELLQKSIYGEQR
jgi:hypothetical protein